MKKNQKTKLFAAVVLLGAAATAQAGFILVDDHKPLASTTGVVPNNEFKTALDVAGVDEYTFGASLGTDSAGSVTYYYVGKEAGYRNDFLTGGQTYSSGFTPQTQNHFDNPLPIGTFDVGKGLLDFSFCAYVTDASKLGCVTNAQNDWLNSGNPQSIAFSIIDYNTAWLFWDDSGAGPDDNHDDMLIKAVFKPTAAPEPGTLALFGVGLLGLVAGARRKQKQT